ncbi:MAG: thiamine diphosphokinase [Armatimonadetes bacterium 13_1_40CM_64_14]|nr:MAG: thiamine diphosphokinase [Armatimonadetes bacterium 13_1_40CM_64_14]
MRAAIVGNGRLPPTRGLRQLLRRADLVVCADGGLRPMRALGITPQVAIGDFDSASPSLLAWARRRGTSLLAHPRQKDQTDTELAIQYALRAGATSVDLIGVLGGRLDHTLANIGLLVALARQRRRARIVHGSSELFLATPHVSIPGRVGDRVSLIPLSARVTGVSTHGLKYPLADSTLRMDATRGISNEITASPAHVRTRRGWLLVVIEHRS